MSTNAERIERAAHLLQSYLPVSGEGEGTQMTDIIADLMHYANNHGLHFGLALNTAMMHFKDEVYPEGEGEEVPGGDDDWPDAHWFREQAKETLANSFIDRNEWQIYDYDPVDASGDEGVWVTAQIFVYAPAKEEEEAPNEVS